MYISSYLTLNTALSGVEAAQEELDTTGQNITNANTPDYEEQTVNLTESTSLDIAGSDANGAMQLGEGVTAAGISNSSDPYLDSAWRQTNSNATASSTTAGYLTQIQDSLGSTTTGTGIGTELSTFWSDWNTLSDNPTSAAAQQTVVNDGETLAGSFNSLSQQLNGSDPSDPTNGTNTPSVLGQVNTQYQDVMAGPTGSGASGGTLYNDAYNISTLNGSIVQAQAAGENANDLIDQRNAAIDSLSSLGSVSLTNNTDGSVSVYFGGVTGTALVADPEASPVSTTVPRGDNFGSNATTGGAAATGWMAAFQNQYATAGAANQSAAALGNKVGGTLGSLIGLAGYSYTAAAGATPASGAFSNLGVPETDAGGDTTYPDPVAATELGTIGTVSASLDSVATTFMNEVNNPSVASTGTETDTATGTTPVSASGTSGAVSLLSDFFTLSTAATTGSTATAANIQVASTLQAAATTGITPGTFSAGATTPSDNGVTNIQTSTLLTGYAGNYSSDNDVALDEAGNTGGSADTAYAAFISQVGSVVEGANNTSSTQSALQTQVTNQRESAEGVDLSQEMANLITEQQSYQASAKVMNAFSTVMDSLMTIVGQ